MDDIRSSFSRFKKDIKHRLGGRKRAPDRAEVNPAEGRTDPPDSLLRPDHHAAASGYDEEGTRSSADVSQVRSRGRSPRPEPTPAGKGNDDPQRREADVDERDRKILFSEIRSFAGQRRSRLDLDTQVAEGSGPNWGIYFSQPSPSLPRKEEPDST